MDAYVVCRNEEEAATLLPVLARKLNISRDYHDEMYPTRYIRVSDACISYGYGLCIIKKVYTRDLTAG